MLANLLQKMGSLMYVCMYVFTDREGTNDMNVKSLAKTTLPKDEEPSRDNI